MKMKELFSFDGRINRKTFWCRAIVILILIGIACAGILGLATGFVELTGETGALDCPPMTLFLAIAVIVLYLIVLVLVWAGMSTAIKRCHDLDKEGWYSLVAGWNVFVLPFAKGSRYDNRFGPPPR